MDSANDTSGNGGTLLEGTSGDFHRIVGKGDPVPGYPQWTFNSPGPERINSRGQAVFNALVLGTAGGFAYHLFSSDGTYKPLLLPGQPTPDLPGQVMHITGNVGAVINKNGQVAMIASYGPDVSSTTAVGVFVGTAGNLHLIGHTGPFDGGTSTTITNIAMNARGQVVYQAFNQSTLQRSIWGWDPAAGLMYLGGDGLTMRIDGMDQAIKYVAPLLDSGGDDGRARCLNDSGVFVMKVTYADGTDGIVTTQIPEPVTLSLLALGGLAMLRRRK